MEPFPPPEEDEEDDQPAAGPSRRKDDTGSRKRLSRRNSDESTARTRSVTPSSRSKRKLDIDEDEPMPEEQDDSSREMDIKTPMTTAAGRRRKQAIVDEREKSVSRQSTPRLSKDHLSVPTSSGPKSQIKNDKTDKINDILELAQQSESSTLPHWIQKGDIGLFLEHRDVVTQVAWNSKNPNLLASTSIDSTARFWELRPPSNEEVEGSRALVQASKPMILNHKSIEGNRKAINALSWHPDGTLLATGAGDGVSRMFTPNGALTGILAYGRQSVNAIKFSPNGSMVLTATDEPAVNLFNVSADPPLKRSYDAHTGESISLHIDIGSRGSYYPGMAGLHLFRSRPKLTI